MGGWYVVVLIGGIFCAPSISAGAQQLNNAMVQEPNGTARPVPDPTVLTTQAQERSITALRELFDARLKALEEENKIQKANLSRTDDRIVMRLDNFPALIENAIVHLQRLVEEKFKGVADQFQGRDVALAAALLAQKTSVSDQNLATAATAAKTEAATTKQIDGIQAILQANTKATDDKIDGVKVLLASQAKSIDDKIIELRSALTDIRQITNLSSGALAARGAGQTDLWAYLVGAGGFLLALFAFISRFTSQAQAQPQPQYYQPQPQYYQQPPTVPNSSTTTTTNRPV